jgi:transcription initiation factor TFIIE subunit alpha
MMPKRTEGIGPFLANDAVRKELISCAGENAIDILKLLGKETEDEKIAGLLRLKVSDVRSVLNRLNEIGIAFYDRTKNEDTGWYYYNWSVDMKKFRDWVNNTLRNQDARIKYAYLIEEEHYYCPQCGIGTSFAFNDAADLVFKCPSCSNTLELIESGVLDRYFGRPAKAAAIPHAPHAPKPSFQPRHDRGKVVAKSKAAKKSAKLSPKKKAKAKKRK